MSLPSLDNANVCSECLLTANFRLRLRSDQRIAYVMSNQDTYFCMVVIDDSDEVISGRMCQIDLLDTGGLP